MSKIPKVDATHWFFRAALSLRANPIDHIMQCMPMYGNIYNLNVPFKSLISLHDPDGIKHVLVTNNKNYKKDISTRRLSISLGNGLLTSEGDFWRRQRRIAQPAFHRERLQAMGETMIAATDKVMQDWEGKQESVDIAREMMVLTSDIAARALFGASLDNNSEIGKALVIGMRFITGTFGDPFVMPLWIPLPRNRVFNRAQRVLDQSIHAMIAQRREAKAVRHDLLAMLMDTEDEETGERMSDRQLRDEVITLFSAGHETSANGLTWTFYLLSQYPEIRKKLEQEVDTVLAGRTIRVADLPQLPYTLKVIQESMRLYPPAWAIGREALGTDEIIGYPIPKGSQVLICTYALHRHPELWPEPERFDPERFQKDTIKQRHRHAYLPFGGGPRFCIGNNFALMEMQLALAMITRRFRLDLVPDHPIELEPLITLRPRHGMRMHISRR